MSTDNRKQLIVDALRAFIEQRPGLEFGNYCSGWNDKAGRAAYFSEARSITRDLHDARELLRYVELRDSISADDILIATRAYSGRLSIFVSNTFTPVWEGLPSCKCGEIKAAHIGALLACPQKRVRVDYCTGQYFPTEFRKAACAVLSSAIWDWFRSGCMPSETSERYRKAPDGNDQYMLNDRWVSPGDFIRKSLKREFGARLAKWMD